jgi:hypothetical protein
VLNDKQEGQRGGRDGFASRNYSRRPEFLIECSREKAILPICRHVIIDRTPGTEASSVYLSFTYGISSPVLAYQTRLLAVHLNTLSTDTRDNSFDNREPPDVHHTHSRVPDVSFFTCLVILTLRHCPEKKDLTISMRNP